MPVFRRSMLGMVSVTTLVLTIATTALPASATVGWMNAHPFPHPWGALDTPMAYDAATGTVVLFGSVADYGDTWIWDGTASTCSRRPRHVLDPAPRWPMTRRSERSCSSVV